MPPDLVISLAPKQDFELISKYEDGSYIALLTPLQARDLIQRLEAKLEGK